MIRWVRITLLMDLRNSKSLKAPHFDRQKIDRKYPIFFEQDQSCFLILVFKGFKIGLRPPNL